MQLQHESAILIFKTLLSKMGLTMGGLRVNSYFTILQKGAPQDLLCQSSSHTDNVFFLPDLLDTHLAFLSVQLHA